MSDTIVDYVLVSRFFFFWLMWCFYPEPKARVTIIHEWKKIISKQLRKQCYMWSGRTMSFDAASRHHVYNLIFYNFTWKHPDKNNKVYFVVRHFKFFFTLSRCLISRIAPSIWYFQTSPWSSVAWDFNDWIEKFIFILKTMTIEKHTIYGVSVGSDWAHTIYLSERSWV